jgi:hypothetical protein
MRAEFSKAKSRRRCRSSKQADALLVNPDILFGNRRVQLATLAARYAVPTMYPDRQYTEVGGLMSYGTRLLDQYRQLGI